MTGLRRALFILLACLIPATAARAQAVDFAGVTAEIESAAEAAVARYHPAAGKDTAQEFSDLYFDVFEASGMEAAIGARDPGRKSELEARFGAVIALAAKSAPEADVSAAWQRLQSLLNETVVRHAASSNEGSFAAFMQAFLILLREGFEAILVVGALTAYLRRLGAADRLKVVWGGVAAALAASLAVAWLLDSVVRLSGQGQEAVEGITMLVAAAVLAYVSHWLFAKREADRWQGYVKSQIQRAVSHGQMFTLGLAAFLAVFREGAETVLFYQALLAGTKSQGVAIAGGFGAGAVALAVVYLGMRQAILRLPLGLFFGVTAVLLYALAITFAGGGVLELQEARWLPATPLANAPTIPWLGVYPTAESLAAQGVLVALLFPAIAAWVVNRRRAGRVAS